MSEHFSKATVEAMVWCKRCGGSTMHYVYDGRRGGCQACIKRRELEAAQPKQAPAAKQESLFG